jgi:hypothetical protein
MTKLHMNWEQPRAGSTIHLVKDGENPGVLIGIQFFASNPHALFGTDTPYWHIHLLQDTRHKKVFGYQIEDVETVKQIAELYYRDTIKELNKEIKKWEI